MSSSSPSAARSGPPALRSGKLKLHKICRLDDIVPNTGVCALVGREQVALFRLDDDRVYAVRNHDPFSGANVISRGILGDIKDELVVASAVYKQQFSLVTCRSIEERLVP